MKIKIIKSTVCDLKKVYEGDVVAASDGDARLLIAAGKAIAYKAPAKKPAAKKKAD